MLRIQNKEPFGREIERETEKGEEKTNRWKEREREIRIIVSFKMTI